jgi:ubiquinone/menaquinone biosynthesis C-methylase UbiE
VSAPSIWLRQTALFRVLNTDLLWGSFYLDVSRPLPLPSATFTHAFGEHVIEHITERQGLQFLRELYRVLRPGGGPHDDARPPEDHRALRRPESGHHAGRLCAVSG